MRSVSHAFMAAAGSPHDDPLARAARAAHHCGVCRRGRECGHCCNTDADAVPSDRPVDPDRRADSAHRDKVYTTLHFDWPSVYIEVDAVGPLSILISERWAHGNEYSISLNGVESSQLNTTNSSTEYVVLRQGESGHVRIEKVTEGRPDIGGLVAFHGLKAGKLRPLQNKSSGRRIECIEILWIAIRTTVLGRRQDRMAYCTGTTGYHLDLYR